MTPETLKAWRTRLSLGEAGMAAYLGVPVTTYRKWENGTRKPDAAPLRLFTVLQAVERESVSLHLNLLSDAQDTENKPAKGRKPRAATQAPTGPRSPAVPPWIHAADALPSWMNGGPHA